jgi:hypothetical protein
VSTAVIYKIFNPIPLLAWRIHHFDLDYGKELVKKTNLQIITILKQFGAECAFFELNSAKNKNANSPKMSRSLVIFSLSTYDTLM